MVSLGNGYSTNNIDHQQAKKKMNPSDLCVRRTSGVMAFLRELDCRFAAAFLDNRCGETVSRIYAQKISNNTGLSVEISTDVFHACIGAAVGAGAAALLGAGREAVVLGAVIGAGAALQLKHVRR
jgi:hypothetical protein